MKCVGLWYGGLNYACPGANDAEDFNSLKHAKRVFEARADFDPYFPCVEGSEMHVYFGEYTEDGPDRIIRQGKRGGTIVERN